VVLSIGCRQGEMDFDFDGDGWDDKNDCEPEDATIHPEADELPDCVDNDCDGVVDEGTDRYDDDGDGYCEADCCDGDSDGDCDDTDDTVAPGLAELPDCLDNDCDGAMDEGLATVDGDGDGFCEGYVWAADDPACCDDAEPGDCDDEDPDLAPIDEDGDGHHPCGGPTGEPDCDEASAAVYPGAEDVCDEFADNDCDGEVDGNEEDGDGDGYSECAGDCDDSRGDVSPDATEVCDGLDNDCDGTLLPEEADGDGDGWMICDGDCDDADAALTPADSDGDGLSSCDGDCDDSDAAMNTDDADSDGASSCAGDCNDADPSLNLDDLDGDGWTTCSGECDDGDPASYPGASEVCDGADNDCDGAVPADETTDGDGDGAALCADCDDGDGASYPGASEVCDGADNDCDGVGPGDEVDGDGDGSLACADCDDSDGAIYPGAAELCDGLDNDCDGSVPGDEVDGDGDGALACADCDDADGTSYPGATELCDGVDNDCDGTIPGDEADDDGDGHRPCSGDCDDSDGGSWPGAPELCDGADNDCDSVVPGDEVDDDGDSYRVCSGDCDDAAAAVNPGATEVCDDGADNDCDGTDNGCFLTGTLSASSAHAKLTGEAAGDEAGAVAAAGDVNQDGYADLLVGAPGADAGGTDAGRAYLWFGPVAAGAASLSTADHIFTGEVAGDLGGSAVAAAGDVNADGADDLLIGASCESAAGSCAGAVYLVHGPFTAGSVSLSSATAKLTGEDEDDNAGFSVASAGDINGDGYDDILVGAPYHAANGRADAGAAYVVHGPVSGTVSLSSADARLLGEDYWAMSGWSVSSIADLDSDGYDEVAVGARGWQVAVGTYRNGAVNVLPGPLSGDIDLATADALLTGVSLNAYAGSALNAADMDGDGLEELLVGAPGQGVLWTCDGVAYLVDTPVSGQASLNSATAALHGEDSFDAAGSAVDSAGDVDGDGQMDLIVGAPDEGTAGTSAGAGYLVYGGGLSGNIDLTVAGAKFTGEAAFDALGTAVCAVGDTNGDGFDDFVISAPSESEAGAYAGAVYLYLGSGGM